MASLSLPRVLQLKKNSLDAEREQFEKFQVIHKTMLKIPTSHKFIKTYYGYVYTAYTIIFLLFCGYINIPKVGVDLIHVRALQLFIY